MLKRLLRPSAFKVAMVIGLLFAVGHLLRRVGVVHSFFLDRLESKAVDWKFAIRGPLPLSHKVALAEIDDRAVQKYGLWPWNRALTAQAVEKLAQAGASSIALDMVFSDPDRNSAYATLSEMKAKLAAPGADFGPRAQSVLAKAPASLKADLQPVLEAALREHELLADNQQLLARSLATPPEQAFRQMLEKYGDQVVLGTIGLDPASAKQFAPAQLESWRRTTRASVVPNASELTPSGHPRPVAQQDWDGIAHDAAVQAWLAEISGDDKNYGTFSMFGDPDGTMRRYLPMRPVPGGFFPSLAVAAVARPSGFPAVPLRSRFSGAQNGLEGVSVTVGARDVVIPVDVYDGSRMLVNFVGDNNLWHAPDERGDDGKPLCSGASCDRVSVLDVLEGTFDPNIVKGKVVFVGVTALGTFDQRVTPFSSFGPGVFVHMNAAEDIVSGRFLAHGAELTMLEALAMLLIALALGLALPRVGHLGQLAVVPMSLGGCFGANVWAFNHGTQLSTVTPLLEIAAVTFGVVFFQYFTSDKEKRQVRTAFQYYLTESVMTEMLKDPSKLKLGGEKKNLTVLFSDIRGFTTLSEMLEASEVARTLNEYLTPMTNLVFEQGGTLDKYMGDAIMAFWGAPVDQPDHALRACETACKMLERLDVMRAEWKAKGRPDIDIGIGLNSGLIHVGNMGSDIRFDYTVIGDDVNLASRLEGTNKSYGTRVIIGENTYREVKGRVVARELGGVVVKGKKKPVTIFELRRVGTPTAEEQQAVDAFERGLRAYRARDWDGAEAAFAEVQKLWPHDGPSEKYLDDLAEKRSHPPDEGWDGVYVMKTK